MMFHVNKLEKYKDIQTGQRKYGAEWFVDEEEAYKTLKDITNSRIKNDVFEYCNGAKGKVVDQDLACGF
ncbi:hypothetical protein K3495_g12380 [Podosphaera aphanis]|nr:hypothetical protein K3495_g12380 [Podosphaera aphanis]